MENMTENKINIKEIDIVGLAKKVLCEKRLLAKFIVAFAIVGVIYALNKPKEYTSIVVIAPEASSMGMSSSLSDIAGMVGLNIGGNGNSLDAIYPEIYPDIFASPDFIVPLFNVKVRLLKDSVEKRYYDHIVDDVKIPFWNYPMIFLRGAIEQLLPKDDSNVVRDSVDLFQLTRKENDVYGAISKNIGCQMNKGTNIITISVTDNDPLVAAIIADTLQQKLQDYITLYRTKKARIDYAYHKEINTIAKEEYQAAQKEYSSYADSHIDAYLTSYKTKSEELEEEMQLKHSVYSQSAAQMQQARAKIQERTPVFTVVQRASVPLRASSFPRSFMVIGFMILGIFCDAAWVLFVRERYEQWKQNRKNKKEQGATKIEE